MPSQQPEPRYLAVGRILRPHGVRGELKVEVLTDFPEHLVDVDTVYIGPQRKVYSLTRVRPQGDILLMTFKECADRNAADLLRGSLVQIALENAIPLEEDEYYHFQVLGMQVETDDGVLLGEIVEVFSAPNANDVFVVHGPDGEILLPVIEDVVVDLDVDARQVIVHLLPGLLD